MNMFYSPISAAEGLIVILPLFGVWLLLLRVLKIPGRLRSTTLDQARQLVFLNDAFMLLLAGTLWIVELATAQFTFFWGILFLVIGVMYLIQGLRWKPEQKP